MMTLDDIKREYVPIFKKYGVKELWLFGSYARGEQTEESDIDFYYNVPWEFYDPYSIDQTFPTFKLLDEVFFYKPYIEIDVLNQYSLDHIGSYLKPFIEEAIFEKGIKLIDE